MARSLRCPRCSTVVTIADGQTPLCPSCGFGGPGQPVPPAQPAFQAPPAQGPQPTPAPPGFSAPPQPSYGQGFAPQAQGRTDGMCIAALVMGCLGWLSVPGIILSILAIVFGVQGINRCKRMPGLRGHGMAVAGIVLGCVFLAFWLLVLLFIGTLIASFGGW